MSGGGGGPNSSFTTGSGRVFETGGVGTSWGGGKGGNGRINSAQPYAYGGGGACVIISRNESKVSGGISNGGCGGNLNGVRRRSRWQWHD